MSVRNLWDREAGVTRGFEVNHSDLLPKWTGMRLKERIKRLALMLPTTAIPMSPRSTVLGDLISPSQCHLPPKLICNCLVPKSPLWQEILRCDFHRCRETGLQRMDLGHS